MYMYVKFFFFRVAVVSEIYREGILADYTKKKLRGC